MKTLHISFEGPSGGGKTTQARILTLKLRARGLAVEYVKNPNGTSFGKKVMETILHEAPSELAQILAFASCFCQSVQEKIGPLLHSGVWVVSDRGIGSAYAHALHRCQGAISEPCFVAIMSEIGNDNSVFADLTFFLDLPLEKGGERKEDCDDRSKMDVVDFASLREAAAYANLSKTWPNWFRIDASQTIEEVAAQVWARVEKEIDG